MKKKFRSLQEFFLLNGTFNGSLNAINSMRSPSLFCRRFVYGLASDSQQTHHTLQYSGIHMTPIKT